MKNIIFIIFFALTFSQCSHSPLLNQKKVEVEKFLSALSAEEKFFLEYFFRSLIQEDVIGYSLIHAKPMSFFDYLQPKTISLQPHEATPLSIIEIFFEGFIPSSAIFHEGFKVWKKYEHLFCCNNIFFDFHRAESTLSHRKVIVLNRQLLLPVFERYLPHFQRINSSLKDADSVFKALLSDEGFKEKFYSSTALVGVCLGYGEKSALLFESMVDLLSLQGLYGFTLRMQSSPKFHKAIKKKMDAILAISGPFKSHKSKKFLFSWGPSFRADSTDPEIPLLQEKYLEGSKALSLFYGKRNSFLEKTLNLIIAADNCQQNNSGSSSQGSSFANICP